MMNRISPLVSLALVLLAGCGSTPSEPAVPFAVVAITANPIASAAVGTVVPGGPTFEVRSASGVAIAGIPVTVAVTAGGGQLSGAPSVSLAGPTSIGQWTLGTTSGPQTVTVSVVDLAPLVFTIPAVAGPAAELTITEGNGQFGTELMAVPGPLRVRVRDAFGNPVAGATISWAVNAGGGSLSAGSTSVTDSAGVATAPAWTLGALGSGEQAVVASLASFTARFTATVQLAPASFAAVTGAPSTATVFTTVAPSPSVVVRDVNGTALAGIPISISITAGNGTLTGAPAVTSAGPTAIGTWVLGTTAATQTVTATVAGFPSVVFTSSATPDVASTMILVQGGGQVARSGTALPIVPRVRVADRFGNGVLGESVVWTIAAGGGSLSGSASSTTDGAGIATGPIWTIGKNGGAQSLVATSGSLSFLFSAAVQSDFGIDLRFAGTPPSGAVALAFQSAASRISAMIIGDVPDVQIGTVAAPFNVTQCNSALTGITPLNELVDDLIIYASVVAIDGVGGTLGSAGPCLTRTTGGLPALGTMRFDLADLDNLANNGRLADVILHEMLHIVGIGTIWESRGVLAGRDSATVRMTGVNATAACVNDHAGGAVCIGSVPAENCLDLTQSCGAGTKNSHWKESIFRSELMTGYSGSTNPMSKMTAQSLVDLGYTVHLGPIDPYTVPPPSFMAGLATPGFPELTLPEPLRPRFTVDRGGAIRPILR